MRKSLLHSTFAIIKELNDKKKKTLETHEVKVSQWISRRCLKINYFVGMLEAPSYENINGGEEKCLAFEKFTFLFFFLVFV